MPLFRRLALNAGLALAFLSSPAPAQPVGWADLVSPDRLIGGIMRYGLMALRTQLDFQYGDLSSDLRDGRATLSDLRIWPLPGWEGGGDCEIRIDRLTIRQAPFDQIDRLRLKATAFGIRAPLTCLPPDQRPAFQATGANRISLPVLGFDIDYDIPSAGAQVQMNGVIEDLFGFDLVADFAYLWFDGRIDPDNPEPVVVLSSATLGIENAGGWELARTMLPPAFSDPATADRAVETLLSDLFTSMNRGDGESAPDLNRAQRDFATTAGAVWAAFLKDPQRLVLETGLAAGDEVYLDFNTYENDPARLIADLRPRLALAPARAREVLPAALLRAALSKDTGTGGDEPSAEDRIRVGTALVTGKGAPRNIPAGIAILSGLAGNGNPAAAQALAEALETRRPQAAYRWGLIAGAAGQSGAAARLDRLERVLPMATVLRLQTDMSKGTEHPLSALESVAEIKRQARLRLTGNGAARSYGIAVMWAILAAATGDAEAADMLEEIDRRMLGAGPEAMRIWTEIEAESSRLALDIWLSRDLPASFGATR